MQTPFSVALLWDKRYKCFALRSAPTRETQSSRDMQGIKIFPLAEARALINFLICYFPYFFFSG